MYLDFFKFRKNPFHITPDPDFLFLSPSHKEASASIFYGIEQRKGFVAVTGEVGVGKTTILRSYLEGTDPETIRIVYIFNAALSFEKLLKHIVSELGIEAVDEDPSELVDSLFRYLIDEYKNDRNVVLIIDEAQNMPVVTLERLRMLSNLETSQDKLLQIILVGQPEFENKLNLPELRQLKQRIAVRCRINALAPDESIAYIQHRLMKASLFRNPVFTKGAMERIVKEADGIPRTINILCDNALVTAFGYQRKPVDVKIIKEVIKDLQGELPALSLNWKFVWVPALVVFIGLIAFASRSLLSPKEIPAVRPEILSGKVPKPPPATEIVKQAEVEPAGESAPKAKQDAAVPEIKPTAESTSRTELGPTVPEVERPVASAPKTIPVPVLPEVKPPVVAAPEAKPEPSVTEPAATGNDKNVSETAPESTAVPAQPSVKPQMTPPVTEQEPKKTLPARVIKRGDSVSKLLMDTCGKVDDDLLRTVKDLNPQINDINVIREGEEIILPKLQQRN